MRIISRILKWFIAHNSSISRLLLNLLKPGSSFYFRFAAFAEITERLEYVIEEGLGKGLVFKELFLAELFPLSRNLLEPKTISYLEQLDLRGKTVLDIGASYGYFSVLFSRLIGSEGCVYAFEPDLDSFNRLMNNLSSNNCSNVFPINCGLSNFDGFAHFKSISMEPWTSTIICTPMLDDSRSNTELDSQTIVSVSKLDNMAPFFIKNGIHLIKIDVEGEEFYVLEGGRILILQFRPDLIIELHSEDTKRQVFELLEDADYEITLLDYQDSDQQHIIASYSG